MRINTNRKLNLIVLSIILLGAATRLLPHPPNFTAIGAIALFGGAFFTSRRLAILLPLAALFLADLLFEIFIPAMGFHQSMPFVYISFVIITLLGFYLRKNRSFIRVGIYSLVSSVIFFAISNFGSWLVFYPQTPEGLVSCYIAAIPFFHYNVLGDLFFNAVFFLSAWFIFQKSLSAVRVND